MIEKNWCYIIVLKTLYFLSSSCRIEITTTTTKSEFVFSSQFGGDHFIRVLLLD